MEKNFEGIKTCLNCEHLYWWDGDYCCMHPDGEWRIKFESKDGILPNDFGGKSIRACSKWEKLKDDRYGF